MFFEMGMLMNNIPNAELANVANKRMANTAKNFKFIFSILISVLKIF